MVDRKKVLKGLGCLADENSACHSDCPYFTDREEGGFCFRKMAEDALELLKEQPEQKFFVGFDGKITPLPIQKHGYWVPIKSPTGVEYGGIKEYTVREVMCSECGFTDDVSACIYTYCPECGAKMEGKDEKKDET